MNCQMTAWVYSDDPQAIPALTAVEVWMAQVEAELSRFRPQSDLSRLNAANGSAYHAGDMLWQVTKLALAAAEQSEGLFDPLIGQALIAAGYDQSFEHLADRSGPGTSPLTSQRQQPWTAIRLDEQARTITLPEGHRLDLGGIAKGWAADYALALLADFGPALIDAGGDLAIGEPPPAESGWPVAIADPFVPSQDLALLSLSRCALATSGTDFRRWQVGGESRHHLIDPITQISANTDVLQASVLAPTAATADVQALLLTLAGRAGAERWLHHHPHTPALLCLNNGRTYQSPSIHSYVHTYRPLYEAA